VPRSYAEIQARRMGPPSYTHLPRTHEHPCVRAGEFAHSLRDGNVSVIVSVSVSVSE